MKTYISILVGLCILTSACDAQIKNAKTETVKINGNCGMCETTIEKAGTKKNLYKTKWNIDAKTAEITYDPAKTDLDHVLKQIALAGYDNERFIAPEEAYNNLHGCCQYDRDTKTKAVMVSQKSDDKMLTDKADVSHHHEIKNEEEAKHNHNTEVKTQKDQLNAIFNKYFELKDALVKSNGSQASTKSQELVKAIKSVEMNELDAPVHKAWMKVEKGLQNDAEHIAETKELDHQRDHFASLSKNMYDFVKVAKPEGTIYYDHCPMYNDNKGANWLSKEKAIKNPYYGNQMLTCGKVIEQIK